MGENKQAFAALAAAMALAGSTVVAGKWLADDWPVFLVNGLRLWIAAGILWLWMVLRREGFPRLSPVEWGLLALQAFTGVFLFNICMLYGLMNTTASMAGIIVSSTPAVIGLLSWLILRERLTVPGAAGVICTSVGILLAGAAGDGGAAGTSGWLGALLVFAAVGSEAIFTVTGSATSRRLSPLAQSAVVSLLAGVMFLPFSLYQAMSFSFTDVTASDWLLVVYVSLAGSVFSYLLWYREIARVNAGTAGVFVGVLPVTVLLLSAGLLKEPLTWQHAAATVCVVAGIAWMGRHDVRRNRPPITCRIEKSRKTSSFARGRLDRHKRVDS